MYIKLTTHDEKGNTMPVLVNLDRAIGFQEHYVKDIGGNPIRDDAKYPSTYTEVVCRGQSLYVTEPVKEIEKLIEDKNDRQSVQKSE